MKIVREYYLDNKVKTVEVSGYPDLYLTPEKVKDAANYPIVFADKKKSNE